MRDYLQHSLNHILNTATWINVETENKRIRRWTRRPDGDIWFIGVFREENTKCSKENWKWCRIGFYTQGKKMFGGFIRNIV